MKFVCEECQAKYQIGDDKVAGRTLRMKCRKCGHTIQLVGPGAEAPGASASIPEASRSMVEATRSDMDAAPQPAPSGFGVATGAAAGTGPTGFVPQAMPKVTDDPDEDESQTSVRPVSMLGLMGAGAADRPRPGIGGASAAAPQKPRSRVPTPTSIMAAGPQNRPAPRADTSPEEWYVGVAGSPIGPVRRSVVRDKISAGEVDENSLVWREGQGDWRPLKTVPSLFALFDELANGVPSRAIPAAPARPAPAAPVARPAVPAPRVAPVPPQPAQRTPVGAPKAPLPRPGLGGPLLGGASPPRPPAPAPRVPAAAPPFGNRESPVPRSPFVPAAAPGAGLAAAAPLAATEAPLPSPPPAAVDAPIQSVLTPSPAHSLSNGSVSNGSVSNGSVSNGSVSNGSVSNGSVSNGSVSNGSVSNGSVSNGSVSNGNAASHGEATNGAAANGLFSNGSSTNGSSTNASSSMAALATPALDVLADPFAKPDPFRLDPFKPIAVEKTDAVEKAAVLAPIATEVATSGKMIDVSSDGARSSISSSPPLVAPPLAPLSDGGYVPQQKGPNLMAWAFVLMFGAFMAVAAWALFFRKPNTQIVYQTVTVTATEPGAAGHPPPAPPSPNNLAINDQASATPGSTDSPTPNGGIRNGQYIPGARSGKIADNTPTSPIDTSGFSAGSSGGPNAPSNDSGGKGQLSQGEIEGVVNRSRAGIARRCWEPAYEARDASAGKSAKLTATISIGASGAVENVSVSGGADHFPGLASCVSGSIRNWRFPASDGPSTTVVPFSFNQQ